MAIKIPANIAQTVLTEGLNIAKGVANNVAQEVRRQGTNPNGAFQQLTSRISANATGQPGRNTLSNVSAQLTRLSTRANSPGMKTAMNVVSSTASNLSAKMQAAGPGSRGVQLSDVVGAFADAFRTHVLGAPSPQMPYPHTPATAGAPMHTPGPGAQPGPDMAGTAFDAPGSHRISTPNPAAPQATQAAPGRPVPPRPSMNGGAGARPSTFQAPMRPTTMAPGLGRPSFAGERPFSQPASVSPQSTPQTPPQTPSRPTSPASFSGDRPFSQPASVSPQSTPQTPPQVPSRPTSPASPEVPARPATATSRPQASFAGARPFSQPASTGAQASTSTMPQAPSRPTTMAPGLGPPSFARPAPFSTAARPATTGAGPQAFTPPRRDSNSEVPASLRPGVPPQVPPKVATESPTAPSTHSNGDVPASLRPGIRPLPANVATGSQTAATAAAASKPAQPPQNPHAALGVPEGAEWHQVLNMPQQFIPEKFKELLDKAVANGDRPALQALTDRVKSVEAQVDTAAGKIKAHFANHPHKDAISSMVDAAVQKSRAAGLEETQQIATGLKTVQAQEPAQPAQTPHGALGVPEGAAWHQVLKMNPQLIDPAEIEKAVRTGNQGYLQHLARRLDDLQDSITSRADQIKSDLEKKTNAEIDAEIESDAEPKERPAMAAIFSVVNDAVTGFKAESQKQSSQIDAALAQIKARRPTPYSDAEVTALKSLGYAAAPPTDTQLLGANLRAPKQGEAKADYQKEMQAEVRRAYGAFARTVHTDKTDPTKPNEHASTLLTLGKNARDKLVAGLGARRA